MAVDPDAVVLTAPLSRRPSSAPRLLVLAPALVVLLLTVGCIVAPQWIAPSDPIVGDTAIKLSAPTSLHPFGTDFLGRDLLSRVVYGAAPSVLASTAAVVLALAIGAPLGMCAALVPRSDGALMRMIDIVLALPGLLLALALVALLGFSIENAAIAVGIGLMPYVARLVRTETQRVRSAEFVEVAISGGVGGIALVVRHIIPNIAGTIAAYAVLQIGHAILSIATLGFLGFGAQPPWPEWGLLIAEGRDYLASAWWLTTFPGIVVIVVVVSLSAVSRELSKGTRA